MTYKICYWDEVLNAQFERDATLEEAAEIDSRKAAALIPIVPQTVTMKQARRALLTQGVLATADTAIKSLTGFQGQAAQIDWEYSAVVERNNILVAQIGQILNLSNTQIDELFILASTL